MAYSLAISRDYNGVAPTISDGCQMTSIQDKTFPFMLLDEFLDGLVNLDVLLLFHGEILLRNSWRLGLFDFVVAGGLVQFANLLLIVNVLTH